MFPQEGFVPGEEIMKQLSRENDDFSFHLVAVHGDDYGKGLVGKHVAADIISNFDEPDRLNICLDYGLNKSIDFSSFKWHVDGYYTSIYIDGIEHGRDLLWPFLTYVLELYPKAKVWVNSVKSYWEIGVDSDFSFEADCGPLEYLFGYATARLLLENNMAIEVLRQKVYKFRDGDAEKIPSDLDIVAKDHITDFHGEDLSQKTISLCWLLQTALSCPLTKGRVPLGQIWPMLQGVSAAIFSVLIPQRRRLWLSRQFRRLKQTC
jgi:hypothetical protein